MGRLSRHYKKIQPGWDNKIGWDDFFFVFLTVELHNYFHNFPLLVEIVDKTTFPNSVIKFNSQLF